MRGLARRTSRQAMTQLKMNRQASSSDTGKDDEAGMYEQASPLGEGPAAMICSEA